jgi:hypothetical protein
VVSRIARSIFPNAINRQETLSAWWKYIGPRVGIRLLRRVHSSDGGVGRLRAATVARS